MRLDYKKTFLLGLGFFSISLVWPIYNYFVPLFLKNFIDSQFWINSIMTLDNILAVTLIPFFGSLSDKTQTRFGRRLPYLMVGIPLSVLFFILLPSYTGFWNLLLILFFLNLSMAIYRAPAIALMPDITPAPLRSKANGIINFMGGLASVSVLYLGSYLYEINNNLPFISTSALMLIALILLYIYIKEPRQMVSLDHPDNSDRTTQRLSIIGTFFALAKDQNKNTLYILLAIFFWFVGYNGVETTFSNYSVHFLEIKESAGMRILTSFAASFLIFSIPSGFIATKFGKKKTILAGIFGLIFTFTLLSFVRTPTTVFSLPYNLLMTLLLATGGFCWACVNINSYPMVIENASKEKIGAYTGLYYFSSSLAAILGPVAFGFFVDLIGYETMFPTSVASFLLAFLFISFIKTEEPSPKSAEAPK